MDGNGEQYFDGAGSEQGNQEDLSSLLNPQSLAEAFKTLRVVEQELDSGAVGGAGSYAQPEPEPSDYEEQGGYDEPAESGPDYDGGPEVGDDPFESVDWKSAEEGIRHEIDQEAMRRTIEFFKERNIRKFSMEDLYEQSDDGTVNFVDPDSSTENRKSYFQNRSQAREWVEGINREIDEQMGKHARKMRSELMAENKPRLDLIKWGPVYSKLNQTEREIVDELISPYEVSDSRGNAIGYSCDLNKMTNQAKSLAARFAAQQEQIAKQQSASKQQPQQSQVRRPTSEIGSRGSNGVLDDDEVPEINSLSDAIKYYEKQKAKGKRN